MVIVVRKAYSFSREPSDILNRTNSSIKTFNMNNQFENGKIVVAIRAARSAIGWNQQEFADRMGVAKSTVARIETLEIAAKGDFVLRALRIFREAGVEVDISAAKGLPLLVSDLTVKNAIDSLADDGKRRSDRRVGIASLLTKEKD